MPPVWHKGHTIKFFKFCWDPYFLTMHGNIIPRKLHLETKLCNIWWKTYYFERYFRLIVTKMSENVNKNITVWTQMLTIFLVNVAFSPSLATWHFHVTNVSSVHIRYVRRLGIKKSSWIVNLAIITYIDLQIVHIKHF